MAYNEDSDQIKIDVLTPVRRGGPYYWGENLSNLLNKNNFLSRHVHNLNELMITPFYNNADLIHAAVPLTYRFWRKPVILTIKGDYTIEQKYAELLYPTAIKKADIVTTPSRFLKEKLDIEDAHIIPNAIFLDRFEPVRHSEKNIINVVTITAFSFKEKASGILDIVKILNTFQEHTDKVIKYNIVGGGSYLEDIRTKVKKYSNINIQFTGWVSRPEQVLRNSDVFAYYSFHDNFPNVILEAMASGLPVITNNVGAVREIIENRRDGYVAVCREDYQEYFFSLLDNFELRCLLGQNARKKIEDKFDWNTIILEYLKIYSSLIAE